MKLENLKGLTIGAVIGALIGVLLSVLIEDVFPFDNLGIAIAFGISLGAAFGLACGAAFDKKGKDDNSNNQPPDTND